MNKHMFRQGIGRLFWCGALFGMGMILCSQAYARQVKIEDFPFSASLEGEVTPGPVKVAIPSEILSGLGPGLTDCRIFDDLGEEVPFFIDTLREKESQAVRWEIIQSQETGEDAFFLISNPNGADSVNNIEIIADQTSGFADIEIYSAAEEMPSQLIAKGRVADLRPSYKASRMGITFPETFASRLEVILKKPALKAEPGLKSCGIPDDIVPGFIPLSGTYGFSSMPGKGPVKDQDIDEAVFQEPACRLDDQDNTIIDLGRVDLPVSRVSIQAAGGCYYREVELETADRPEEYRRIATGAIYRIPGLDLSRDAIAADAGNARFFRIRIVNKEKPPLVITRVSLGWARMYVVFMPRQGRSYEIRYGSGQVPGVQYNLDRIVPHGTYGSLAELPAWKMGRSSANPDYEPERLMKDQFRLYFIIGAMALIVYFIGFWFIQIRNHIPRR